MSIRRTIIMAVVTLGVLLNAGCWNGGNESISLGSVSIGQQMIDLKAALDQEAVSQAEYDRLKDALMALGQTCNGEED